jgi:hypothetical protein
MSRITCGQFVLHAKALLGRQPIQWPLVTGVIESIEKLTGCAIERARRLRPHQARAATSPSSQSLAA